MNLTPALRRAALRVLASMDGDPMPQSALLPAMQLAVRPLKTTLGDAESAVKTLESEGYLAGITNRFTQEADWHLTPKGEAQARQLA
jgi:hypothetical protein